nr:RNA-directed DNA polymerase, eukaryota [Tanacetum cinerariifolium]
RKSRGGAEQIQMTILKEILEGCILSNTKDRWTWSLEGSREFSVSSIRKTNDAAFLPCGNVKTRWVKEVPIKINILAWKVSNDYLPTIFNLSRRELVQGSSVAAKWEAISFDASFCRHIRDGAERHEWLELLSLLDSVVLFSNADRWFCDLRGDGDFRVKDIRTAIDDLLLPSVGAATRWVKHVPIKVSIFAWRARLDRLPTREFVAGGIFIGSTLHHLAIGILGSVLFGFPSSLSLCWRAFFTLRGGSFGPFGIIIFLMFLL